jgi:hypothetical protein
LDSDHFKNLLSFHRRKQKTRLINNKIFAKITGLIFLQLALTFWKKKISNFLYYFSKKFASSQWVFATEGLHFFNTFVKE